MKPMGGRTWKFWPASGPVFKPASFQEKGFIVTCESVCPDVCCRRSEDTLVEK